MDPYYAAEAEAHAWAAENANRAATEKTRRTDAAAAIRAVIDNLLAEAGVASHGTYNHQAAGVRLLDEVAALTKIADDLAAPTSNSAAPFTPAPRTRTGRRSQ